MSMPSRSRSRIAASVLQAGPMVQMIFARRGEDLSVAGSAIDSGLLTFNLSPQSEVRGQPWHFQQWRERRCKQRLYDGSVGRSGAADRREFFAQHGAREKQGIEFCAHQ